MKYDEQKFDPYRNTLLWHYYIYSLRYKWKLKIKRAKADIYAIFLLFNELTSPFQIKDIL